MSKGRSKSGGKSGTPTKAQASKAGSTLASDNSTKAQKTEAAKTLARVPDKT